MVKQPSIQISVSHKGGSMAGADQYQPAPGTQKVVNNHKINVIEKEYIPQNPPIDDLYPGIAQTIRNGSVGS